MIDYKDILTNILNLSDFYHREKKEKGQYLLLEPIIIYKVGSDPEISKQELANYITNFFIDKNNIILKIIDYYQSERIINFNTEKSTYKLNYIDKNVEELFAKYKLLYSNNYNKINDLCSWFIQNIDSNIIKSINISENIYTFLQDTLNNKIDVNNVSIIYKNIANILDSLYSNNFIYLDTIKDILKGMIILKAVENYKKSTFLNKKKIRIYLDNIFITNLFGWCENPFYESSILTLEILKEFNFEICIHNITLELILDYLISAKNIQYNLSPSSLLYNIIHPDFNNKNLIQTRNIDVINIKDEILNKLEEYDIKIIPNFVLKENIENNELFSKIHSDRQKINIEKGGEGFIYDRQTLYDFTIILLYKNITVKKSDINSMDSIFLTYQKAIINNSYYKEYNLYSPIMSITTFINLLLLENVISNIQEIDKLLNIIFINSYSQILHKEFIKYINNISVETNITDKEKNSLLALRTHKEKKSMIIRYESDPKQILDKLNKEKEDEKEKEKQIALDEKEKEKQIALDEKEKEKQIVLDKLKEQESINKDITTQLIRMELDKKHTEQKKRIRKKRICLSIKKIICTLAFSILLFTLLFVIIYYIINIPFIKKIIDKYISIPDIVTMMVFGVICGIWAYIIKIIYMFYKKILK